MFYTDSHGGIGVGGHIRTIPTNREQGQDHRFSSLCKVNLEATIIPHAISISLIEVKEISSKVCLGKKESDVKN